LLFGLFAILWQDAFLAYFGLALFYLGSSTRLSFSGIRYPVIFAWLAGISFCLYLVSRMIEEITQGVERLERWLNVWPKPLMNVSVVATAAAVLFTLPVIGTEPTALATTLAFTGAL
jgi:hypothetical protein